MLNRYHITNNQPATAGEPTTFAVALPTSGLSPSSISVLESDDWDGGDPCATIQAQLSNYADDELNDPQRRGVESHLSGCPKCAAMLNAIFETDDLLLREWRDDSPLPSSFDRHRAIDNIMDALPPLPETQPVFAPKRTHARARWMRFSTGIAGCLALFAMLYSSYRLGYEHGLKRPPSFSTSSASHTPLELP